MTDLELQALNAARYEKLRRWMSSNVPEGWREVENMGAIAAWQSWPDMDAYLDGLPECNVGLCETRASVEAPEPIEGTTPANPGPAQLNITIGNDDPALFAIGKKWIAYAREDADVNDIAAAVWSAIAEVKTAVGGSSAPQLRLKLNLRNFSLDRPVAGTRILAFSPGYKQGDPMRWRMVTVLEVGLQEIQAYVTETDMETQATPLTN